jgi:DNA-binding NtrC family response regulator
MKKLKEYPWPGNVRELKNTIERAVVGSEGKTITARDIQFITAIREEQKTSVLPRGTLEEIEKQTIINALKAQGGNKKATAKVLGIAYSTMCEKVKKHRIES